MNLFTPENIFYGLLLSVTIQFLIWLYRNVVVSNEKERILKEKIINNQHNQWLQEKRKNSNKNIQPRKRREHVCSYCGTYKPNPGKCSKCGGPEDEGEYLESFDISNIRSGSNTETYAQMLSRINDEINHNFPDPDEELPW